MNILITGISAGIGKELCKEALCANHNVIGLSRSDTAFNDFQSYAAKHQVKFLGVEIAYEELVAGSDHDLKESVRALGKVDVLINNAGLLEKQTLDELTVDSLERMLQVNVFYPVRLIQWLRAQSLFAPHAHVVNIGSMGGFQGSSKYPGLMGYSMSKAALANFTECLAAEWESETMAVNCLCLGAVQTEMLGQAFPGYTAPVTSAGMARFILRFAENAGKVMSGQVVPVALKSP